MDPCHDSEIEPLNGAATDQANEIIEQLPIKKGLILDRQEDLV